MEPVPAAPTTTTTTGATATSPGLRDALRYLVVGLVIGALWIAHSDEPVWAHAARTLAVLVAVPVLAAPVLAWWRRRAASRGAPDDAPRLSLVRFVAAKALLVAVALGVDLLLSLWSPVAADVVVALGLVGAVAVLGPQYHHLLVVPAARSGGPVRRPAAAITAEERRVR